LQLPYLTHRDRRRPLPRGMATGSARFSRAASYYVCSQVSSRYPEGNTQSNRALLDATLWRLTISIRSK
jgi:hypothetical protein